MMIKRYEKSDLTEDKLKAYILLCFQRNPKKLHSIKSIQKRYGLSYMTARRLLLKYDREGHIIKYECGSGKYLFVLSQSNGNIRAKSYF